MADINAPGSLLGASNTRYDMFDYATVRNRLQTMTDTNQPAAYATLPVFSPFGNDTFIFPVAEAKALGFTSALSLAGYDGVVGTISDDINNNQITSASFIGSVGLDWQYAGVAPVRMAGESDLVLRNVNTGAFAVYDIANNTIIGAGTLGQVGLDWSLGGLAVDPPTGAGGAMGASDDATSQLVQAMAGFADGSGGAGSLDAASFGADASQQFLTTPQQA
jgi:hypothetical protein